MKTGVKEFKREYKHVDIDQIEVCRLIQFFHNVNLQSIR